MRGKKVERDVLARATAAEYSWFARCISSSSVARRAAYQITEAKPKYGGTVTVARPRARTWTSSGSGVGRFWMRYSICLAFAMRSFTSSFLLAVGVNGIVRERGSKMRIEGFN